ncbi:MAG: ribosome biogenesis factor YjgA [Pseudomonadota bacterium]
MAVDKPSKSARKRELADLVELGDTLMALSDEERLDLALEDHVEKAIVAARDMKSQIALRRQKRFITKCLRDSNVEAIRAGLHRLGAAERQRKFWFAAAERWRNRLLDDPVAGADAFEAEVGADQPELRQLLSDLEHATSDRAEKTLSREVFRRVHDILVRIPQ